MKRLLLAGLIAGSWSSCVFAADLGPYRPPPPEYTHDRAPDVPPLWRGFYIGANVGYGWGNDNAATLTGPAVAGSYGSTEPDGWFGGGQIGYNAQFDKLVLGVEADIQGADISDSTAGGVGGFATQSSVGIDWFSTLRGRIGYAAGPTLLYFTGGFAFADVDYTVSGTNGANSFAASSDKIETGYTLGGGLEWAFAENWSLKSEYLYVDLGEDAVTTPGAIAGTSFTSRTETDFHTVRVGLNYRF